MKSKGAILLTTEDGTLSYDLIEGLEWRGWGDPCRAVVVCPIHPTTDDSIVGFLVRITPLNWIVNRATSDSFHSSCFVTTC